jgi:amino acid permease
MEKYGFYTMIGVNVLLIVAWVIYYLHCTRRIIRKDSYNIETIKNNMKLREELEQTKNEKKALEKILLNIAVAQSLAAVPHPPKPPPEVQ